MEKIDGFKCLSSFFTVFVCSLCVGLWYPHARGQLPGAGSPLSTLWVPGNELRLGESAFIRWDILLALDSLWLLSKCFVVYDCSQRWVNLVFQKAQCAVQLLWANLWNGSRKPFLVHNKWHPNIFPVWAFRHQRRLDLFLKSCGYFFCPFVVFENKSVANEWMPETKAEI